jgi:hypothetical protein
MKLIYDRQPIGQSVLVSGDHLGHATNFCFSLRFSLAFAGVRDYGVVRVICLPGDTSTALRRPEHYWFLFSLATLPATGLSITGFCFR